MSRTNREPFEWIHWLDKFEDRIKRDGVKRDAPQHKRTESNAGWASEGYRKKKAKKWFKQRRNKDDRLALDKELEEILKENY